jgi:hypothetical protein
MPSAWFSHAHGNDDNHRYNWATSLDNKYELSPKEPSLPAIGSAASEEAVANALIELIESWEGQISTRKIAVIIIEILNESPFA